MSTYVVQPERKALPRPRPPEATPRSITYVVQPNPDSPGPGWRPLRGGSPVSEHHLRAYHASLERCVATPEALRTFYEGLQARPDVTGVLLGGAETHRQAARLKALLYLLMHAATGGEAALRYFAALMAPHRGPSAEQVASALEALRTAAATHDPGFTDEVERAWQAVHQYCLDHLLRAEKGSDTAGGTQPFPLQVPSRPHRASAT